MVWYCLERDRTLTCRLINIRALVYDNSYLSSQVITRDQFLTLILLVVILISFVWDISNNIIIMQDLVQFHSCFRLWDVVMLVLMEYKYT
jgi:hypothetical protein